MQEGEGVKSGIGGTLIGLGTIGAASNIGGDKLIEGLIGGAILSGIGGLLIASDKKKKQKGKGKSPFDKEFVKYFKHIHKQIKQSGSGKGGLSIAKIKNIIKENENKEIHIKDILGEDWKQKSKKIIQELNKQSGSGIKDLAIKAKDAAKRKFKQFLAGKTKVKPSTLLDIAAGAVGIAGAASGLIAGVDIISVPAASAAALGLKSAAHLARMQGRGIDIPAKLKSFILAHKDLTKKIINMNKQSGSGLGTVAAFAKALGVGISLAQTAYKLYKFIQQNPELVSKILSMIGMTGSGCDCEKKQSGSGKGYKYRYKNFLCSCEYDKKEKKQEGQEGQGLKLAGQGVYSKKMFRKIGKTMAGKGQIGGMSPEMMEQILKIGEPIAIAAALGITIGAAKILYEGAVGLKKAIRYNYMHDYDVYKDKKQKGKGFEQFMDISELGIEGMKDPALIPQAIEKLAQASGPLMSKGAIGAALGITGAALISAYALYKKLKKQKGKGLKLAGQGVKLAGQGVYLAGQGLPYGVETTAKGKIKKNRYSVYHGFHKKTAGGLTKDDLVLRGKKVLSKKKIEQGKKALQYLKK